MNLKAKKHSFRNVKDLLLKILGFNQGEKMIGLPFKAYEGDEPYIFVSYKHIDSELVFPLIKRFHDDGFNIWYDDGLQIALDYSGIIYEKIAKSSLFIIFITKNVNNNADNRDDFMMKELYLAISENVEVLPIYLEDVELGLKYQYHLDGLQSIFKHDFASEEDFTNECLKVIEQDFDIKPYE